MNSNNETYRESHVRSVDLETTAIHDIVGRMRRLRKRVGLPISIVGMLMAWIGMCAHAFGYWSVVGTTSNGNYVISTLTMCIAAFAGAAPVVAVGAPLYFAWRARLRDAWREEYRSKPVSDSWVDRERWLEVTPHRFP